MRIVKLTALLVAVAVVAAGGATAAKLITGADVRNGSLTGLDLKARSVGPKVFSGAAQSSLRGPKGAPGPRGPSDVLIHRRAKAKVGARDGIVTRKALEAGSYALTASLLLTTPTAGPSQLCALRFGRDQVGAQKVSTAANERVALTITGAAVIPPSGADVRVVCEVAGDAATVTNLSLVAIRAAEVTVSNQ